MNPLSWRWSRRRRCPFRGPWEARLRRCPVVVPEEPGDGLAVRVLGTGRNIRPHRWRLEVRHLLDVVGSCDVEEAQAAAKQLQARIFASSTSSTFAVVAGVAKNPGPMVSRVPPSQRGPCPGDGAVAIAVQLAGSATPSWIFVLHDRVCRIRDVDHPREAVADLPALQLRCYTAGSAAPLVRHHDVGLPGDRHWQRVLRADAPSSQ
jgi:hypothetical protein